MQHINDSLAGKQHAAGQVCRRRINMGKERNKQSEWEVLENMHARKSRKQPRLKKSHSHEDDDDWGDDFDDDWGDDFSTRHH